MRGTVEQRFWAKVNKTDTCWLWTAGNQTYGVFYPTREAPVKAHRFSYELSGRTIPFGKEIDHKCHVKRCVNPAHLRIATRKQNAENKSGSNINGASGVLGVTLLKCGRYRAQLGHNGKHYWGKYRDNINDAIADRKALEDKYFTHHVRHI